MYKNKIAGVLITVLAAVLFIPLLALALVCIVVGKITKRKGSYVGEGQPYPRV